MKKRSIFILNNSDHKLYDEVYTKYKMLVPLIYEPEQINHVTKRFLKDFFFIVYKPMQHLIIYPELTLSYSYHTIFAENIIRSILLKKYGWKFQGNALYSFCFAIYLAQFTTDWLTTYMEKYPERIEEIRLLIAHSATDMEKLFEQLIQANQPYPKDIFIANSNLVKYVTSLMQMENNVFEQGMRTVYVTASALYEDLSMEIPQL
ncbi:MAG: hypothetical protein ABS951_05830 [Solibacillus sp.]